MKDRFVFIAAALESIDLINSYTDGYQEEDFLADRKTQDAVVRNFEIIGQALKGFGVDDLYDEVPDIPWRQVAGMRNILAHEYLGVDMVLIWETLRTSLEGLKEALKSISQD